MDVKWPAPVGNTLINHVCDLFWNPVDIGRRSGHFNKSSWINLGHARVLGIECGQLKNELLGASHRRSCRFLYQNDPERFFGVIWFHPACVSNGPLVEIRGSFVHSFFVHEFLLSFINSSVFKSKHMLCVNKVGSYLSFGITQSLSVSGASSTALVPCGGMTSDVGPINATSNQGSTHAKNCFVVQSKCGKTVSR
jgi:hypothetical protein